jgi:hypothetical protein
MTKQVRKRQLPISVVIATLGGDVLKQTIAHLNQGEGWPAEILICIPEAEAINADCVAAIENVHVIKTPSRGQVAQRAVGLCMAAYPYVMQLDDDVILPSDTLKVLYETLLAKGPGNVVAPFFRLQTTGEEGTRYNEGWRGQLRNCHASMVCGAKFGKKRFGKISSSGIAFGVVMHSYDARIIETEWLPGGVALCHKADLITYDYYPFSGKAFSEDLIHSVLWRQQGCRFWTVLDVSAMIDVTIESFDWKSVMARYTAHAYVAQMVGGSVWRTRLWFSLYCMLNVRKLVTHNYLEGKAQLL